MQYSAYCFQVGLNRFETAELGLEVCTENGRFVVSNVKPYSPADMAKNKIYIGDTIISIDGIKLDTSKNFYSYLDNKANEYIDIAVENIEGTLRYVRLKLIDRGKLADLEYDRWQERNRQIVDSLSNSKLGYIHIKGMDEESVCSFETELFTAALDRDALIIDVRMNGGGHTADYLLGMLNWRKHAETIPRGGEKGYPEDRLPQLFYDKPIAVLCDQWSFSNAEIFTHAVKILNRGKIVGMPTAGGVISTSSKTLLDGSSFRVSFRGWYTSDKNMNEENNGCNPDVIVENLPGDLSVGLDRQLEAAVLEVLK
ncbi:MAG: PDZ domain-containing protein [Candidatus Delongbacteria bacterium]|nr:PDZ domain-containing protein [Candidatus Delongbacteria bacterium]